MSCVGNGVVVVAAAAAAWGYCDFVAASPATLLADVEAAAWVLADAELAAAAAAAVLRGSAAAAAADADSGLHARLGSAGVPQMLPAE